MSCLGRGSYHFQLKSLTRISYIPSLTTRRVRASALSVAQENQTLVEPDILSQRPAVMERDLLGGYRVNHALSSLEAAHNSPNFL